MRAKSLRRLAWEKSSGICSLCGLQMMPDDTHSPLLAYTIEHIVPKSRGGTNDIFNLDGAHQWCNNYKGDSLLEELPNGYRRFLKWKIKNLLVNLKI